MKKSKRSYTVYFGGELFSLKHLIGHGWLSEAIYEKSHGRFRCVLPQDYPELHGRSQSAIRDFHLRLIVACDLALFNFDSGEADRATIAEFMFAKFADIPAVLLRSNHRGTADHHEDQWMAMAATFPRTVSVVAESLVEYRSALLRRRQPIDHALHLAGQHSSAAAQLVCEQVADHCVRAFDRLLTTEPVMPKHLREEAFQWLALAPGLHGKEKALRKEFERHLERKVERDLL